jgi:hypothetical protein
MAMVDATTWFEAKTIGPLGGMAVVGAPSFDAPASDGALSGPLVLVQLTTNRQHVVIHRMY